MLAGMKLDEEFSRRVGDVVAQVEERTDAEVASFWEPGLLNLPKCRDNHQHAAMLAMRHGYRLSIQMQLLAELP